MERGLAPTGIRSPVLPSNAFYLAAPNLQQSDLRAEHEEDDNPEFPLASTGSSSPNFQGGPTSSNYQASIGSTNIEGGYTPSSYQESGGSSEKPEDDYNLPLPPPPGHESRETYIVKVPREQIFRVPPPENAQIVERFRQPVAQKKSRRHFRACLACLFGVAILFVIAALVIFGLQVFLKPQNPEFRVKGLVFKNSTRPDYDISLIAKNPSKNIFTISYEGAEDATLLYSRMILAEGTFPAFEQGTDESTPFEISFPSIRRNSLPSDLEKSLTAKKKTAPLKFTLAMEVPIRNKLTIIPALWSRRMFVKCQFTADGLGARTKILSQECRASAQ